MTAPNTGNPLNQYFRQFRKYVAIPSSTGNFLPEGVVDYTNDKKEVGIMPMTAADEILFKSPDALLNGEAIVKTIQSCVPQVKNARELLSNDIDVLLTAIYAVSYGDNYDVMTKCPKCKEENKFGVDLDNHLRMTKTLDESYPVNLSTGLTAFIKPYTFSMNLMALALQLEESNFIETLKTEQLSETEKVLRLSDTIKKATGFNFDLVCDSVIKVVKEDVNPESSFEVTNKSHIKEFISNISREDANKIREAITKANRVGLPNTFDAKCAHCEHEWETEVSINAQDFFTDF